MRRLTVVIPTTDEPTREWERSNPTIRTLEGQTFTDFDTVVIWDRDRKGANWARNEGFKRVATELVLFSDDDVEWRAFALEAMVAALDAHPEASYAYGTYISIVGGKAYTVSNREFNAEALRRSNFVSTMSILRARDFPGFDESLKRLQDWDLWLTLLDAGKVGVHCRRTIFESVCGPRGITNASIPWQDAYQPLKQRHHL